MIFLSNTKVLFSLSAATSLRGALLSLPYEDWYLTSYNVTRRSFQNNHLHHKQRYLPVNIFGWTIIGQNSAKITLKELTFWARTLWFPRVFLFWLNLISPQWLLVCLKTLLSYTPFMEIVSILVIRTENAFTSVSIQWFIDF